MGVILEETREYHRDNLVFVCRPDCNRGRSRKREKLGGTPHLFIRPRRHRRTLWTYRCIPGLWNLPCIYKRT